MDIVFLSVEDVILIHELIIDTITPLESKHILNYGRLESAILTPQQTFDGTFLYVTLFDMAAALLHGLATGHAFQQGNKRVAFLSCYTFLQINGMELELTNDEAASLTLRIVAHEIDREELARVLRDNSIEL